MRRAQEHGLITRSLSGDVIAFSPPLIISEAEIDALLERTARALDDTLAWVQRAGASSRDRRSDCGERGGERVAYAAAMCAA